MEACLGECGGSAEVDECGECGGDGIPDGYCDCDDNMEDACGVCGGDSQNPEDCGLSVYYSSAEDFAGFQFNVTGVEVTGTSGGAAEAAGCTVSC